MSDLDVVVVGAGPAGLAASRELRQAGLAHVVLERGASAGTTWSHLYDSLVLHTSKELSALPGLPFPAATPRFPSRADMLDYLQHYAETFEVPIRPHADVARLHFEAGQWTAETRQGDIIRARAAIVATGVAANPQRPHFPGEATFAGRILHAVDYRRPGEFAGQRVLVVGVGNSGGEIAADLAQAGVAVTVAVRSGATVVPREVAGVPIQYLALALSRLPMPVQRGLTRLVGRLSTLVRGPSPLPPARPSSCPRVPLIGFHLNDAIKRGTVRLAGPPIMFTREGVKFARGPELPFDAVILATGFRAAVSMLGDCVRADACGFAQRRGPVASADQPRLYFVGHNYGLRGSLLNIRRDARRAARQIKADLAR